LIFPSPEPVFGFEPQAYIEDEATNRAQVIIVETSNLQFGEGVHRRVTINTITVGSGIAVPASRKYNGVWNLWVW
jgi:hypothetical protein